MRRSGGLLWMLNGWQAFRPHLTGAVWRGTATRLNSVHLQLFCDDSKEAELALIDLKVSTTTWAALPWPARPKPVDVLSVSSSPSTRAGGER